MKTIGELIGKRDVYSVDVHATVKAVVDYLYEKKIGAVAVCDGERVVGVFSERDLLRRVVHKGLDLEKTPITDVMTADVYHVTLAERSTVAKALMLTKNFRHLVVLDSQNRLRGFISMRELLEADLEERQELLDKLNDDFYAHGFKVPKE